MRLIITILVATSMLVQAQQLELLASNIDANFDESITLNGEIFFSANDGIYGWELWRSNGTKNGTKLAVDIKTGSRFESSSPNSFQLIGNNFIFLASSIKGSNSTQLFLGNNNSIESVQDIFNPSSFTNYQNSIYFKSVTADNKPLFCVTDGTKNGTKVIDRSLSNSYEILLFDNGVYIKQNNGIYKLNPLDNTLIKVLEFSTYDSTVPYQIHCSEKIIYLLYRDTSASRKNRLVSYNVDKKEFILCKQFYSFILGFDDSLLRRGKIEIVEYNKKIYFPADDGNLGEELWTSDGTISGTTLLRDINIGGGSSYNRILGVFDGKLYFNAYIRKVSNFDYKLYALTISLDSFELNTLKNHKGEPFEFIDQYNFRTLESNKLHFYGRVYTNDPEPSSNLYFNQFYLKTQSSNYLLDYKSNIIAPSVFISDYIVNDKAYYKTGNGCTGISINSLNLNTNKTSTDFVFLSQSLDGTGTISNDDRVISTYKLLNGGVIAAKKINAEYPPKQFGIYYVNSCEKPIELNIIEDEIFVCKRNTITIESKNENFVSYNWRNGCEVLSNLKSVDLSPTESMNLVLLAKDNKNCFSSKTTKVTYYDTAVEVNISGSLNICKNATTKLIGNATSGVAPYSYSWIDKEKSEQISTLDSVKINKSGLYQLNVKDDIGCESPLYEFRISDLSPQNTTISGEKILRFDNETQLSVNRVSGQQYQWYKDGVFLQGETSNTIKVNETGAYYVKISNATCSVESEIFEVSIITSTEPSVSLSSNFQVYPNPTNEYLTIVNTENTDVNTQIFNFAGVLIKSYVLKKGQNIVDLQDISSGTYLLKINSPTKETETFKLSKF